MIGGQRRAGSDRVTTAGSDKGGGGDKEAVEDGQWQGDSR